MKRFAAICLAMTFPVVGHGQDPSEARPSPLRIFNGAPGSARGLHWNADGKNRWRLVTDSSDDLALYSYDRSGNFIDTPLLAQERNRTFRMNWPIVNSTTSAPAAGA